MKLTKNFDIMAENVDNDSIVNGFVNSIVYLEWLKVNKNIYILLLKYLETHLKMKPVDMDKETWSDLEYIVCKISEHYEANNV